MIARSSPLTVDWLPVAGQDIAWLEGDWRALHDRGDDVPYRSWEWLAAWVSVYRPAQLVVARVQDAERGLIALGLIERLQPGRWRFAGAPISPVRDLLCAAGASQLAWRGLHEWLSAGRSGPLVLEAEGLLDDPGFALRRAVRPGDPVYRLDLPGSFDDYLRQRSPTTRKGLKQKLRRLRRAGGRVSLVAPSEVGTALRDFVVLHHARAQSKGERHPAIDGRLTAVLATLGGGAGPRLRVFELVVDGERAGLTVRLDSGSTGYFYNAGIDPARTDLGPGVLLELGSINDAIERGLARFDLGPGTYRYKRDLGGLLSPTRDLRWTAPTPGGRLVGAGAEGARLARRHLQGRLMHRLWVRGAPGFDRWSR